MGKFNLNNAIISFIHESFSHKAHQCKNGQLTNVGTCNYPKNMCPPCAHARRVLLTVKKEDKNAAAIHKEVEKSFRTKPRSSFDLPGSSLTVKPLLFRVSTPLARKQAWWVECLANTSRRLPQLVEFAIRTLGWNFRKSRSLRTKFIKMAKLRKRQLISHATFTSIPFCSQIRKSMHPSVH